ncbi:MAG: DUF296 domain-containing protein [Desulfobacterales bacterium]
MTDRIQTVVSEKGRRIIGRLPPGSDLIKGIQMVSRRNDVMYGAILSAIGSLREAKIVYAGMQVIVSNPGKPEKMTEY